MIIDSKQWRLLLRQTSIFMISLIVAYDLRNVHMMANHNPQYSQCPHSCCQPMLSEICITWTWNLFDWRLEVYLMRYNLRPVIALCSLVIKHVSSFCWRQLARHLSCSSMWYSYQTVFDRDHRLLDSLWWWLTSSSIHPLHQFSTVCAMFSLHYFTCDYFCCL